MDAFALRYCYPEYAFDMVPDQSPFFEIHSLAGSCTDSHDVANDRYPLQDTYRPSISL